MIEKYSIRTDLALEQKERFESDHVEIQGVVLEEDYDEEREIRITRVRIETENGAKAMGKPVGTYITMEAPEMAVPDEEYHREISVELAKFLAGFLKCDKEDLSVLVVGLGNRKVTPDALGPLVVDNLNITRHIVKEYGKYAMGEEQARLVSAIVPGVMGQTGMETVEIVRGVVAETEPDVIIAVDALAARSSRRLNRTIQISDTGISPGSGVGNHRGGLTRETVGVPVIAIGIPTVVDAATIVNDTMENLIAALETSEALRGVGVVLQGYTAAEKYDLVRELISPHLNGLFVTPKDIDDTIRRISYTLSEALNLLFSGKAKEA
ncbi:GPR endopeptidase [Massilistercora timonensis]|uniref:GPR endopeptidase n=1 Tax=Massilistercora timonensis TaxID=2086584 RepID=UPI003AB59371